MWGSVQNSRLLAATAVVGMLTCALVVVAPTGAHGSLLRSVSGTPAGQQLGARRAATGLGRQLRQGVAEGCCQTLVEYKDTPQGTGRYQCIPLPSFKDFEERSEVCTGNIPAGVNPNRIPEGVSEDNIYLEGQSCVRCRDCCPIGNTCGDPHVVGFDGSSYLLYGKANLTYSLISERDHQVNIRLYQPPSLKEGHALFIDAVGIMIRDARISVQLVPGSPAAFLLVSVNGGKAFTYPGHRMERAIDSDTGFLFTAATRITVTSSDLTFSVRLVDGDHIDVGVDEVAANWRDVHGVMGQTHAAAFSIKYSYVRGQAIGVKPGHDSGNKKLHLQGSEDDYIVSGLFGTDNKYNRFGNHRLATDLESEVVATRKLRAVGSGAAERAVARSSVSSGQRVLSVAGVSLMTPMGVPRVAHQRRHLLNIGPDGIDRTPYFTCEA